MARTQKLSNALKENGLMIGFANPKQRSSRSKSQKSSEPRSIERDQVVVLKPKNSPSKNQIGHDEEAPALNILRNSLSGKSLTGSMEDGRIRLPALPKPAVVKSMGEIENVE